MLYDKAISAQMLLHDDIPCQDTFRELYAQIEALPQELRGSHALLLSAQLLELAAFELAGDASSQQVGDLIQKAAELTEQSSDIATRKIFATIKHRHSVQ